MDQSRARLIGASFKLLIVTSWGPRMVVEGNKGFPMKGCDVYAEDRER